MILSIQLKIGMSFETLLAGTPEIGMSFDSLLAGMHPNCNVF